MHLLSLPSFFQITFQIIITFEKEKGLYFNVVVIEITVKSWMLPVNREHGHICVNKPNVTNSSQTSRWPNLVLVAASFSFCNINPSFTAGTKTKVWNCQAAWPHQIDFLSIHSPRFIRIRHKIRAIVYRNETVFVKSSNWYRFLLSIIFAFKKALMNATEGEKQII